MNTSLTKIDLNDNNIGALKGRKAIGEALKVNRSLTEMPMIIKLVMKGERMCGLEYCQNVSNLQNPKN